MRFTALFLAWLSAAVVLGASGALAGLQPPLPQMVPLALTAALITAGSLWQPFRAWLLGLSLQSVVAVHLSRFIGVYFLYLCSIGELPRAWAVPAGVGDTVVAVLAAVLLGTGAGNARPSLVLAWNIIGLADIAMVVVRAAEMASRDPGSMGPLLRLPLSLLPTFLVPIIIASHVLIFVRLRRRWRGVA